MDDAPSQNATPQAAAQPDSGHSPSDIITMSNEEYEKLKTQAVEYLDGWKRAKADYINFKKETEERQSEFIKFSAQAALMGFIPLYDHLKGAFAHLPPERNKDPWIDGVLKIKQEFASYLRDAGIEEILTIGKPFDPTKHESVGIEIEKEAPVHTVVKEIKGGYTLYGKVIIPAQVVISEQVPLP
ncbi:MAG: nucleotide exchange factor GrpE [Patescibacteria group bacterium]